MRENEYDRARREIRLLYDALKDHCVTPGCRNSPTPFVAILLQRSRMAGEAVAVVKRLPHTPGARYVLTVTPEAQLAMLAVIDAFEKLGLHWDPVPQELE